MQTFRVMVEYRIQSSVMHIDAPTEQAAIEQAMRTAPTAQRAYILPETEQQRNERRISEACAEKVRLQDERRAASSEKLSNGEWIAGAGLDQS